MYHTAGKLIEIEFKSFAMFRIQFLKYYFFHPKALKSDKIGQNLQNLWIQLHVDRLHPCFKLDNSRQQAKTYQAQYNAWATFPRKK